MTPDERLAWQIEGGGGDYEHVTVATLSTKMPQKALEQKCIGYSLGLQPLLRVMRTFGICADFLKKISSEFMLPRELALISAPRHGKWHFA
jgi:hypothetical protein